MIKGKHIASTFLICVVLFLLIMDAKTALIGAKDGLGICIGVVIPSLFPFLVISALLPSRFMGGKIPGSAFFNRVFGVPQGAESLVMLGFLSGYPIGAAMIADAYRNGKVSQVSAHRLLGFCNNAGPAFLFGMVASLFTNQRPVWVLWLIHISSALLVGAILPRNRTQTCVLSKNTPVTLPQALESAVKAMANICGWVIVFRIILTILNHWVLWLLSEEMQLSIWGILELTNGIVGLNTLENSGARFIFCSGFLSFGGLCVWMQTISVTKGLELGQYFPGKVLQSLLSILIAALLQYVIFPKDQCVPLPYSFYILLLTGLVLAIFFLQKKKSSSISGTSVV